MKKVLTLALALVFVFALAACGSAKEEGSNNTGNQNNSQDSTQVEEVTITVGATAVPHAEILNEIKPLLKEQGVNLVVKEFTDYNQPNIQLEEKQLDANFFQHAPYLEEFNQGQDKLVSVVGVHIEPFGAYSRSISSIEELADGAKVAIPNDPTNGGRALALLEKHGLITLAEGVGVSGTVKDIVDNPKNLQFVELEAAMLPRTVDEVELALINTNYALEAGFVPTQDALLIEEGDSPYVNILVARPDNKDSEPIQKLAAALTTEEVRQFIEENYEGAVVPAF